MQLMPVTIRLAVEKKDQAECLKLRLNLRL